jgi:LPXTG-motif cell wall-anchored protein
MSRSFNEKQQMRADSIRGGFEGAYDNKNYELLIIFATVLLVGFFALLLFRKKKKPNVKNSTT